MKSLLTLVMIAAASLGFVNSSAAEPDILLADFEAKDYGDWEAAGEAFGRRPLRSRSERPLPWKGFVGAGLAGSLPGREKGVGTLTSPGFQIERRFINFLVWGQRDLPSTVGVELVVDSTNDGSGGRVARAASATEAFDPTLTLHRRTFDVADLAGRTARIRVNDNSPAGAIAVDRFVQSNAPKAVPTDAARLWRETLRPQFHFTAQTGWQNDANGLLYCRGQWHLFHQHRPPGSPAIVWGHAVSGDLLHWRHLPTAIPSDGLDSNFSGSGLVDWENASGLRRGQDPPILLFYTLHPPTGSGRKATQCLAFSTDGGRTFEKFSGNPILRTRDAADRDPKVFFLKAPARAWFMVLSLSRNNTDREHATYGVFRSRDLTSWELIQEIGPGSWYWECPDFFELPLDGDAQRTKWLLMKGSGDYIVGRFDGGRFAAETDIIRTQWGGSFYGAQTFSDAPGGRRVQIAWMPSGKAKSPNAWPGMPFNQQMSFPRELTLRSTPEGPRVFREPIEDIGQLYAKTHDLKPRPLAPGDNALAGLHPDLLDMDLELELQQAAQVCLTLRAEEIRYDTKAKQLNAFGRSVALEPDDGSLILRVLLDRTSIELFGNRGEVTHSGVFFPSPAHKDLSLTVKGGPARLRRLTVHELESIWPEAPTKP